MAIDFVSINQNYTEYGLILTAHVSTNSLNWWKRTHIVFSCSSQINIEIKKKKQIDMGFANKICMMTTQTADRCANSRKYIDISERNT